jgi:outer membrane protease
MRKTFFLVLSALLLPVLSAQESAVPVRTAGDHPLSLGVSAGVLFGRSEEIVYRDAKTRDKLSQLLWEMKPLVYIGADAEYRWFRPNRRWGLFTDLSFKYGVPAESGVMEDRDWTGALTEGNKTTALPDWLTHYSVHNNKTENAILLDAGFGLLFQIFDQFLLKTSISYDLMYFSWTASGGSLLYPADDGDHIPVIPALIPSYIPSLTPITYQQTWHIVSPGITFSGAFNRYFTGEIGLKASPFIWCITRDDHSWRDLLITANLDLGLFIEPELLFSFTPRDFFTLSLAVSYRYIGFVRGDSLYRLYKGDKVYKETGKPTMTVKNTGGAGYSVLNAGIVATFSLF